MGLFYDKEIVQESLFNKSKNIEQIKLGSDDLMYLVEPEPVDPQYNCKTIKEYEKICRSGWNIQKKYYQHPFTSISDAYAFLIPEYAIIDYITIHIHDIIPNTNHIYYRYCWDPSGAKQDNYNAVLDIVVSDKNDYNKIINCKKTCYLCGLNPVGGTNCTIHSNSPMLRYDRAIFMVAEKTTLYDLIKRYNIKIDLREDLE